MEGLNARMVLENEWEMKGGGVDVEAELSTIIYSLMINIIQLAKHMDL